MLDDLKHYAKYAGMWLTTRGVVTLAVLAATAGFGVSGHFIPLLTLPIGLAAATYMNHDRTNYLKTRTKNAYKLELAATLGKNPKEVTVSDLERVAEGDKDAGLPGNGILKERLDHIQTHHRVSLFSTIGAMGLAIGAFGLLMGGGMENVIQSWQNLIQPLTNFLPVYNPEVFAAGTLASGISFVGDYALTTLGKNLTGLNERTAYDVVQGLKKQRRSGHTIQPEQVLEVFVCRDPNLATTIQEDYGASYAELPPQKQSQVLHGLEQKDKILAMTDKINEGRMSPNELTFLVESQHSGLPERQPRQEHPPLFLPHILSEYSLPLHTTLTVTKTPQGTKIEEETAGKSESHTADGRVASSHVERYVARVGTGKEMQSFVKRLTQESSETTQGINGRER